jgi:hypothetical protein
MFLLRFHDSDLIILCFEFLSYIIYAYDPQLNSGTPLSVAAGKWAKVPTSHRCTRVLSFAFTLLFSKFTPLLTLCKDPHTGRRVHAPPEAADDLARGDRRQRLRIAVPRPAAVLAADRPVMEAARSLRVCTLLPLDSFPFAHAHSLSLCVCVCFFSLSFVATTVPIGR